MKKIIIRNKNCKIVDTTDPYVTGIHTGMTIPNNATIYGYRGSTAEKYAKKYGNKFKLISNSSSAKVKVKKLRFKNPPKSLKAGKSRLLKVVVSPKNATNKKLTWRSSNKKYATVSKSGKVTAKRAGKGKTVRITATARDGSKKKVSLKLKIK